MATNMPLLSFTKDNKDCSESNGYISTPFKKLYSFMLEILYCE